MLGLHVGSTHSSSCNGCRIYLLYYENKVVNEAKMNCCYLYIKKFHFFCEIN